MKFKIILLFGLFIFCVGVIAMNYYDVQLKKQECQQLIINAWKNGDISKEQAVQEIKDLRENLAIEYCELNGCKIMK